jgi:CubicO group peptidase (beta-lactamase class C family)
MTKASGNIVATLALLTMMAAGGNLAWAQSTAKQSSAPVAKADKVEAISIKQKADTVQLQTSAGQATGRIQASTADKKALVDSVRSKNQDTVKAVLLRNGFTAEQVKDAKIVLNDNTGGKGGAEGIKITIGGSCCPPTIVITIRF